MLRVKEAVRDVFLTNTGELLNLQAIATFGNADMVDGLTLTF